MPPIQAAILCVFQDNFYTQNSRSESKARSFMSLLLYHRLWLFFFSLLLLFLVRLYFSLIVSQCKQNLI